MNQRVRRLIYTPGTCSFTTTSRILRLAEPTAALLPERIEEPVAALLAAAVLALCDRLRTDNW